MEYNIEKYNTEDDDLIIIGGGSDYKKPIPIWIWIVAGVIIIAVVIFLVAIITSHNNATETSVSTPENAANDVWYNNVDVSRPSSIVVADTIVDSLHLKIITPYNVVPELRLGRVDTSESDILLAALAADVRRDNGKIVGAFVLAGEPLSWGLSKRGYCAISEEGITIGVAENSPLFEQATENGGSFFRQYPSVNNGKVVENNPKNASFRRALCVLNGKIHIVVCTDRVLMNDFSKTLVKMGVVDAIFLVGGTEDGWYRNEDGTLSYLGKKLLKNNPNINYLVFRAQ
ncbi:MAG: hypothetical protein IK032_09155 [Bacteroidales bacterium]|nr:hypothetical protein [Bacteroidales bacterium]MBR5028883.1 hypothetical protein [Bacteroidales bacterium]